MYAGLTRDTAATRTWPVRHTTGRTTYIGALAHQPTGAARLICPHNDGHRSRQAAEKCAARMWRQLPEDYR